MNERADVPRYYGQRPIQTTPKQKSNARGTHYPLQPKTTQTNKNYRADETERYKLPPNNNNKNKLVQTSTNYPQNNNYNQNGSKPIG